MVNIVCQESYERLCKELLLESKPLCKSKSGSLNLQRASAALQYLRGSREDRWASSNLAVLYDLDALSSSLESLQASFVADEDDATTCNNFLHCYAIKSCPLSFLLGIIVGNETFGLEAASRGELFQALRIGTIPFSSCPTFHSPSQ